MPPFRILRVTRPKWRAARYRRTFDVRDLEKSYDYDEAEEDDWQSQTSSRSSSASYNSAEAMLKPQKSTPREPSRAYDSDKVPRKRFNLYFSIILGSILVLTALSLTLMGQSSTKAVASNAMHSRPAVWEDFPLIDEYFGGLQNLVTKKDNVPIYPGKPEDILQAIKNATASHQNDDTSALSRRTKSSPVALEFNSHAVSNGAMQSAQIVECFLNDQENIRVPNLRVYDGSPSRFPDAVIGSHDELGSSNDVCVDRFGRLGPYGFGYSRKYGGSSAGMEGDTRGANQVWANASQVDFREIKWVDIQQRCFNKNRHRFQHASVSEARDIDTEDSIELDAQHEDRVHGQPRTALVVRTRSDYSYDAEDIMSLRALITELVLMSGAQVEVHFLVHVKDDSPQFWTEQENQDKLLAECLPKEFHGMATLWSEQQMSRIYGNLGESVHPDVSLLDYQINTILPLQYFAHEHPEYDNIWNWEMDVRYTGHFLDLLTEVGAWAKRQPRKGLWERNARYYVPVEHGSWEDFKQMVRVQTEHSPASKPDLWAKFGIKAKNPALQDIPAQKPVWGAQAVDIELAEPDMAIEPSSSYHEDHYTWGVGEQADLLTFSPIYNPESTSRDIVDELRGYDTKASLPARRETSGTTARFSRRLLQVMHQETAQKQRTMPSESWPASVALHYGLKAVYVPLPTYIDRQWPVDFLAAVYNGGRNGATGGSRTSIFNDDREHNLRGITWSEDESGFGAKLWKRWLGYRVDGKGGEEWELSHEGRMCLPPMLLHPVKHVELVYDGEGDA